VSSIYLVKRPGVSKTAVPDFIDYFGSLNVVFAIWPILNREDCPSPNTVLMVICEGQYLVAEELIGPSALAAEVARADL